MSLQATLRALADPTRREILMLLRQKGSLNAGQIGEQFPVTAAAISRQTGHTMFLRLEGGVLGWGEDVNSEYPHLYISRGKSYDAQVMQQHLISQLQYMVDHDSIARKLDPYASYDSFLKEAQNDEITYCGAWVTGTGAELLTLYDTGVVSQIWAQEAHISLY